MVSELFTSRWVSRDDKEPSSLFYEVSCANCFQSQNPDLILFLKLSSFIVGTEIAFVSILLMPYTENLLQNSHKTLISYKIAPRNRSKPNQSTEGERDMPLRSWQFHLIVIFVQFLYYSKRELCSFAPNVQHCFKLSRIRYTIYTTR